MKDDPVLCYCFDVKRADVLAHFARPGATLDDFIANTRATTKCTACALDLDMILDEIHSSERLKTLRAAEMAASRRGLRERVDRVDSGFFLCDGEVQTHLCLANFPSVSGKAELCAPHNYRLTLYANDGQICVRENGHVGANEEVLLRLYNMPGCPKQGWFHLHLKPVGTGRYGTLRPQVAFEGKDWAACYHTQFHTDATRTGRRSGTALRSVAGKTRTRISVINGSGKDCPYSASLEWDGAIREIEGALAPHGACMIDIDDAFGPLPESQSLIFRIESLQPTRKNLVNCHPDGKLGFDHFPNLV